MNNCALSQDGKVIDYFDKRVQVGITTVRYGDFKLRSYHNNHDYKLRKLSSELGAENFFRIIPRHNSRIIRLNEKINNCKKEDGDAVIYSSGNWILLALIHCSWITLKDRIIEKTFDFLENQAELKAVIYSGICQKCYEVRRDVFGCFTYQDESHKEFFLNSGKKMYFNLSALIKKKLLAAGIKKRNIETIDLCSLCGDFSIFNNNENGKLLYSHRRHRDEERNLIYTKLNGQNIFLAGTTGNCPYVVLYA